MDLNNLLYAAFPQLQEQNQILNDFNNLIEEKKKWCQAQLQLIREKTVQNQNASDFKNETSKARPKRKAYLEASQKIREDSLMNTKSRRIGETTEVPIKDNKKKLELSSLLNSSPNITQPFINLNDNVKNTAKILNSTHIRGKEFMPEFPNISLVDPIEKFISPIDQNTITLINFHESSTDEEVIDKTIEKISKTPKGQTKKSSLKELFNHSIKNTIKNKIEAFETYHKNNLKTSPEQPIMRVTRTKSKEMQSKEENKNEKNIKVISTKIKKHSITNKNRQSFKVPPNDEKKINKDKIENAIKKKTERLNLIKDDLKKKNNEKMQKACQLREALEKQKQIKVQEIDEKLLNQEQKKKNLEQKRLAEQKKKLQNPKQKKELEEMAKQITQQNAIMSNIDSNKKIKNLKITTLQSEKNRIKENLKINATFTMQNQNQNTSYNLTPVKKKQNNEHTLHEEDIEEDDDDDDDDKEIDNDEKKFISKHTGNQKQYSMWTQYKSRNQFMLYQSLVYTHLFGNKDLKNINEIFPEKHISRRSSAIWNTPLN